MKTLVFNGWAAGREAWDLCSFSHDWVFDYVEQLDGLPERVMADTDAAVLVGWSMGGSTALRMALEFPEKVKGVVLVAATPRMMADPAANWKGMSERRLGALRLGTKMAFAHDPAPEYAEANMERGLDYLRATDLRAALASRRFDIPAAILQSERDPIVHPDNAAFLAEVFPLAKRVKVPGNEHVLPVTVPEAVDAAVEEVRCLAQRASCC